MYTVLYPTVQLKLGGAEQQLLELVRGLDKRRFRPIVTPLYAGGALEGAFQSVPDAEVICLHRRHKYDFAVLGRTMRLLQARQIDVVQPYVSPAAFFGLLASLLVRTPVTVATERSGARNYRALGARTYQAAENHLMRYADVAVANSEAGRRLLIGAGVPAAKTRVIENGVNPDRLQPSQVAMERHRTRLGAAPGTPVVGILATLTPAKDHQTFLRAASELARERPNIRFAIVGDGPLRAELQAFAAEHGLAERAVFLGFERDVADVLAVMDVLVSASRDNEGHSNSIIEAMALGRPVVATDVGGNRELVRDGETGLLVPCGDHRAMASAIGRVLDHPAESAAGAERARAMVQRRFGIDQMVDAYQALYEELLARQRGESLVQRSDAPADRVSPTPSRAS
jgi:glycosyltransferase involved in cell wall biosynthesis